MSNRFCTALAAAGAFALLDVASPIHAQLYGMMNGDGPGNGMGQGYGPAYMMGPGYGHYGSNYAPNQDNLNLSVDEVKTYLERTIRNHNLKVGAVKEKDADTITAEVVTKQGNSLVQRFDFNRHSGFYQPEQ